jgi:hypothetical protein
MGLHETATTIAVTSAKGGAGKTTTVVALADALTAAGHRVGIVDLDVTDPNLHLVAGVDGTSTVTVSDDVTLNTPMRGDVAVLSPLGFDQRPSSGALGELAAYLDVDVVIFDLPPGIDGAHSDLFTLGIDGVLTVAPPTVVGLTGHVEHCGTLQRLRANAAEAAHKKRDKRRKYVEVPIGWASAETCGNHIGSLDGELVTVRRFDAADDTTVDTSFASTGFTHLGEIGAAVDDTDRAALAGIVAAAAWVETLR